METNHCHLPLAKLLRRRRLISDNFIRINIIENDLDTCFVKKKNAYSLCDRT